MTGSVRVPWWLYVPSPLTGVLFSLLGATGPELRSVTAIGYGGIAAIFIAQTVGTIGGAAASGVSKSLLFRPIPMALISAAALALVALVDDPLALIPILCVAGFGCYSLNARAQADLSLGSGGRPARALSLYHVFGGLGAALFPFVIAGLLRVGASWRVPFIVVGGLFAAYGVACLKWPHSGDPPELRLSALRRVVKGRSGAALIVACVGTGVMFSVPLWIPTLMHERFGWSSAAASLTSSVYMLALLVSRLVATVLVTRVSGRLILLTSALLVVAGHVLLFTAWSAAALLLAAVAVGAGSGPLLPVAIARVALWSKDDRLGTATVMGLAAASQILFPGLVVGAHAAGLSLQHAAAVSIIPALLVVGAARRA
jgi:MFS transporter, FHS family, glucose/mannose:H+ symporter